MLESKLICSLQNHPCTQIHFNIISHLHHSELLLIHTFVILLFVTKRIKIFFFNSKAMKIVPTVLQKLPKHILFHFKQRKFDLKIRQTKTNQNKALSDRGSQRSY